MFTRVRGNREDPFGWFKVQFGGYPSTAAINGEVVALSDAEANQPWYISKIGDPNAMPAEAM